MLWLATERGVIGVDAVRTVRYAYDKVSLSLMFGPRVARAFFPRKLYRMARKPTITVDGSYLIL